MAVGGGIFPQKWCAQFGVDDEHRESIVNKTAISAVTNRTIGGVAPSQYLGVIEAKAQVDSDKLDALLSSHLIAPGTLRANDFEQFFVRRREALCQLVERATGKSVPRDIDRGEAEEDSAQFETAQLQDSPSELD